MYQGGQASLEEVFSREVRRDPNILYLFTALVGAIVKNVFVDLVTQLSLHVEELRFKHIARSTGAGQQKSKVQVCQMHICHL
jgi:hypothetical protein